MSVLATAGLPVNSETKRQVKETFVQLLAGTGFLAGALALIGLAGYGVFFLMGNYLV